MGTLFLVATPIGNLEDITLRALRVLREVRLIAAEDTRHTKNLLRHYKIDTPLVSYHAHNERERADDLVVRLRSDDVALVSDAGTPTISDPGHTLILAALAAGHRVVPVPGPSAILTALTASGLPTDRFLFVGFLPRRKAERRAALAALADERVTLVLYEAPHRVERTLADAIELLGDRPAVAGRELTKLHEELIRGRLSDLLTRFEREHARGEITLVIGGAPTGRATATDAPSPIAALQAARARGLKPRAAAAEASRQTGLPARELYRLLIEKETSVSIK